MSPRHTHPPDIDDQHHCLQQTSVITRALSLSFNRAGLIRLYARWPRASTLDSGTALA